MATKRETRKVFTLRIQMDNDVFLTDGAEGRRELARLLTTAARDVEHGETETNRMLDDNGNTVGEWIIAEHKNLRFTR